MVYWTFAIKGVSSDGAHMMTTIGASVSISSVMVYSALW